MRQITPEFRVIKRGDRVLLDLKDGKNPFPIRIVWARPLSGPKKEVSILDADKKKEILLLSSLENLEPDTKKIIKEELQRRYFLPKITRVINTKASFGNRYWQVETDRGERNFLMKSPETNAEWLNDDHVILRDSLGNHYEIESFSRLDPQSRQEAEKVL
ncbi:DUF1854 domain-containing protein [Candidatus Riflebacteria bacterium]